MNEYKWKTVSVVGFDELMRALDYADRKGFMPDAIKEEWDAFNWKPEQPAQQQEWRGPVDWEELAEQAGINIDSFQFSGTPIKHIVDEPSLEKFAELIVRECAELVDRAISDGGVDGRVLKQHFGVES